MKPRTDSGDRRSRFRMLQVTAYAVTLLVLAGCQSTQPEQRVFLECECGTVEHDILGCTHECCLGRVSCENPACTCPHADEAGSRSERKEEGK